MPECTRAENSVQQILANPVGCHRMRESCIMAEAIPEAGGPKKAVYRGLRASAECGTNTYLFNSSIISGAKQGLQTGVIVISGLLSYDALPAVHPHIPLQNLFSALTCPPADIRSQTTRTFLF